MITSLGGKRRAGPCPPFSCSCAVGRLFGCDFGPLILQAYATTEVMEHNCRPGYARLVPYDKPVPERVDESSGERVLADMSRTFAMTLIGPARAGMALTAVVAVASPLAAAELNDYPTAARADYVFACMKTNGETRQALEQCSCSIDVIASILPYDRYVAAETVLSLSQVPGRFGAMFQTPEQAKTAANELRRAQAEAEVRCF